MMMMNARLIVVIFNKSTQNHEDEDDDNGQNSLSSFFLSLEQHQHTTKQGWVANVLGWVCLYDTNGYGTETMYFFVT